MIYIHQGLMEKVMEQEEMIFAIGRRRAFTLIEMLVVLGIIAMLLGITIPFTTGFGKGLRLKTASRAILGTLRVARSNAITYREKHTVVFDIEKGEYWIEDSEGRIFDRKRRLPVSIKFRVPGEEESEAIDFEDDKVIFYPTGAIEGASGSITITDQRDKSRTVSILGSTGKISID
ncbi:GspH/FimT family pseudopilin [Candidatus Omnitrophota bacterium]